MSFYKVSIETFKCLSTRVDVSRSTRVVANFTIEMIGNETGPLVKGQGSGSRLSSPVKSQNFKHGG